MGYYDSVKDSIKEQNQKSQETKQEDQDNSKSENNMKSNGSGGFGTLKEAASQETKNTESDDTDIEVLEEGLKQKKQTDTSQRRNKSRNVENKSSTGNSESVQTADTSNLEEKLDKIIEQNARMIEVLESFGK